MNVSCASLQNSLLTGIGTGAVIGAAGGSMTHHKKEKKKITGQGAMIGAVVGGITSYLIHNGLKKREANIRRETIFNLDKHDVSTPTSFQIKGHHGITMPLVDSELVKEHVTSDGKKLIESHRIWNIREDAQFVPAPRKILNQ